MTFDLREMHQKKINKGWCSRVKMTMQSGSERHAQDGKNDAVNNAYTCVTGVIFAFHIHLI